MMRHSMIAVILVVTILALAQNASAVSLNQSGADRLTALQNNDGGWDWPLTDGDPNSASPQNTVSPIAMGLAQAYKQTGDPSHRAALLKAGTFLLANTNSFSPSVGYMAVELDGIFGGTTYTSYVKTNYYDKLAAGTYNRGGLGTLYDTAGYINAIRTERASQGLANMAAWDIGVGLYAADAIGVDTTEWVAGTKAAVNAMTIPTGGGYDYSGLAGSLLGLASVGATFDPTSGYLASAASLQDMGDILAGFQVPSTGGFSWWTGSGVDIYEGVDPMYTGTQYTAYDVLALHELNPTRYASQLALAGQYLKNVQLGTGGWNSYPPYADSENNEITGEALWAMSAVPEPGTLVLLVTAGLGALAYAWRRRRS
jgi:hypothetical protein